MDTGKNVVVVPIFLNCDYYRVGQEMEVGGSSSKDSPSVTPLSVPSYQLSRTRTIVTSDSPSFTASPKPATPLETASRTRTTAISSPLETFLRLQTPKTRVIPRTPSTLTQSALKLASEKPSLFSPVLQLNVSQTPSSSLVSSQKKPASGKQVKTKFSEVMVKFGGEKEYKFSKPKQVAGTPPVPATPRDGASKPAEPVKPFVFSPPLLRSASRERKSMEFARLGLDSSKTRQVIDMGV